MSNTIWKKLRTQREWWVEVQVVELREGCRAHYVGSNEMVNTWENRSIKEHQHQDNIIRLTFAQLRV